MSDPDYDLSLIEAAELGDTAGVAANIHLAGQMVDDWSALMLAARCNRPECVRLLFDLEGGLKDRSGRTALSHAGYWGLPDCSRLLLIREGGLPDNAHHTGLHSACTCKFSCTFECVALHLPREYDVESQRFNVRDACSTDEKRSIVDAFLRFRHLIAADAAALSDAEAIVAFRIAAQCGLVDVVRALAPRCAGTLYYHGRPAITYAICEGQTAVVEALLPFEAGIVDADGYSNLQLACAVGIPEIVELLAAVPVELASLHLETKSPADYCVRDDCRAILEEADAPRRKKHARHRRQSH